MLLFRSYIRLLVNLLSLRLKARYNKLNQFIIVLDLILFMTDCLNELQYQSIDYLK